MILKPADEKSRRQKLLEDLQQSAVLDFAQKKWLRTELMRLRKGIQGERDSAHYLDSYFKTSENHVVLHDLRFVLDGEVAQIDHLVINRGLGMYLVETKNYAGNLVINDHGEFTVEYDDVQFGIESPIEQSNRHGRILARLLETLEIVGRTQKQPELFHVVMLHPKARIQRPNAKAFDTSNVIKADQFPSWHGQFVESKGVGTILKAALNMRSLDTIREWGEKLIRQHRPADLMALPDFMLPKSTLTVVSGAVSAAPSAAAVPTHTSAPKPIPAPATTPESAHRLICAHCGTKISFAEGKFCWNNPRRFNGQQYCREHQGGGD